MAHLSSLVLTVEIMAGTHDKQAAIELTMMATDMGCIVEANQRGITMRAHPGADWQKTLQNFERDERIAQYPAD